MLDSIPSRRALIVTALALEYKAVRARLRNLLEHTHRGTVYEVGDFLGDAGLRWSVCIVETGSGNAVSAAETERAINYFDPEVVFFVGIAGGLKDVVMGDVVAATKVYGYESGKAQRGFSVRPDSYRSSYDLQQRARAEAKRENWSSQPGSGLRRDFRASVAPIASGEKVIASQKSAFFKFIRSHYGDAVAVEMEGLGFMVGAAANFEVKTLVIRGISDLLDRKEETDALGSKDVAADHASMFAFQVLSKLSAQDSRKESSPANTGDAGAFSRSPQIDPLLAPVRLGELKTAADSAAEIVRSTDAGGHNNLFESLLAYHDCRDEDLLWKAITLVEACCEIAPWLVTRPMLFKMASHQNFSVRGSAAVICMNLAQYAPEMVPVDILERLSVYTEDWYVERPANAALKAMCRPMPALLHIYFSRLRSSEAEERSHAAAQISEISEVEPELLDSKQLNSEISRLSRMGDGKAADTLRTAFSRAASAKPIQGYKYGL
ncbi:MAG: 5'-methylthioadenosine/S-adenosylhomocysteine nucleosidase [Terriglobales bacterium]